MEAEFGIQEYVGNSLEPIRCILKELYSDFIVQEIIAENKVLSLHSNAIDESIEEKIEKSEIPAPECMSEEVLKELNAFVNNEKKEKFFLIDVKDSTKEQRTAIHKYLRQQFNGSLNSELVDGNIKVSTNDSNQRKRKRWSPDIPDYLHFTLAKQNKDTSYALGILAKFIGVKPSLFRTCGIKDKRAVTSQRVSCYRVEKEKIIRVLPRLRDFTCFDFEYQTDNLKMGGHWGNRFSIILRNIPLTSKDEIARRCEILREHGFINYFGTQRFGSSIKNTAETGKLILQRKWELAVKNIFKISKDMGNSTVAEASSCFLETGDPQAALKKMKGGQAFASIESSLLRALSKGSTWQQCLTDVLPMNMRSLYVHAYQSLIWNKIASRRVRELGSVIVAEDVDKDGHLLMNTDDFSAHIPLAGSDLSLYPSYAKIWQEELLSADGQTNESFTGLRDRFALGDATRPLIVRPTDVAFEFIYYDNPRQELQAGLNGKANEVKKVEADSKTNLALKIQFNLPNGCYATVALRQVSGFDMGKVAQSKMNETTDNVTILEDNIECLDEL